MSVSSKLYQSPRDVQRDEESVTIYSERRSYPRQEQAKTGVRLRPRSPVACTTDQEEIPHPERFLTRSHGEILFSAPMTVVVSQSSHPNPLVLPQKENLLRVSRCGILMGQAIARNLRILFIQHIIRMVSYVYNERTSHKHNSRVSHFFWCVS
jgi:hypothetical protein